MGKHAIVAVYVIAMVVAVVGVGVLFLRHQFWPRLLVNIGIVAVFAGGYFLFLKRSLAQPRLLAWRGGEGVPAAYRCELGQAGRGRQVGGAGGAAEGARGERADGAAKRGGLGQ